MLRKSELTIYLTSNCNLKCTHCLPGDGLIFTDSGLLEIQEIASLFEKGETLKVLTHKGNWKKITKILKHPYKGNIISIKPFCLPSMQFTMGHKIFVYDNGKLKKTEVEKIKKESLLWIPKQQPGNHYDMIDIVPFLPPQILTTMKLRKVDLIEFASLVDSGETSQKIGEQMGIHPAYARKLRQNYKKNRCKKDIKLFENDYKLKYKGSRCVVPRFVDFYKLAKLLGYYCAEGHVHLLKNRPNSALLEFTFGKHEKLYIAETQTLIKEIFGLDAKVRNTKTATTISCYNAIVARLFTELCGRTSHEKKVPGIIFNSDKEITKSFLIGYINGDGSRFSKLGDDRNISFTSVSKKLSFGVALLFLKLNYIFSYHLVKTVNGMIEGRAFTGKNAHVWEVHRTKAKKLENELFGTKNPIHRCANVGSIAKDDGWVIKIHEIHTERFDDNVFNLTVEDDESYAAPFCVVSNCYRPDGNHELSMDDLMWIFSNIDNKRTTFLGGEPFLYPHLKQALDTFPQVTLSTNGMLLNKDNVGLLTGINGVQLSVEIGKENTTRIRGKGVWEQVLESAKLLEKENIKYYYRVAFWEGNLGGLKEFNDMNATLVLFPRIDKPVVSETLMSKLFEEVLRHDDWTIAIPNFLQYIGKNGRCKAGSERINVLYNKKITPCNFDLDYHLGKIGDAQEEIEQNISNYLDVNKVIPHECLGCKNVNICRGSCYATHVSTSCPLRYDFSIESFMFRHNISANEMRNHTLRIADFMKTMLVC